MGKSTKNRDFPNLAILQKNTGFLMLFMLCFVLIIVGCDNLNVKDGIIEGLNKAEGRI